MSPFARWQASQNLAPAARVLAGGRRQRRSGRGWQQDHQRECSHSSGTRRGCLPQGLADTAAWAALLAPLPGWPCWHRCLGVGGMVPGARCEWTQQKRKLDEHCGHQGIRTLPGQGGPKRPQPLCLDSARSWCPAGEDPLMMMAVGLLDTEQERVGLVGKWRISDPVDQKLENFTEEKQFRIQVVQPLWAPLSNPLCPAASLPHQPGGHSVAFLQRWEPRS